MNRNGRVSSGAVNRGYQPLAVLGEGELLCTLERVERHLGQEIGP